MYKITHPSFERDMEYTEPFDFADFVGICVGFLIMAADCRGDWRQRVPIEKDKIINFLNEVGKSYDLKITKE